MFSKIYEFIKKLFKENYKSLIFFICFFLVMNYPVPYYIFTSGGITDLSERFEVDGGYTQKGSYNLSYVLELEGNILTFLAGHLIPSWEIVEMADYQITTDESVEDLAMRSKLSLLEANQNAVMIAYEKAGKTIDIKKKNLYIAYTASYLKATVPIKIGDVIESVDGNLVSSFEEFVDYVNKKDVGSIATLSIKRGEEIISSDVEILEVDGKKAIGLAFYLIYDYEVSPEITFKFSANESGASAGLMTTLAIYDTLIEDDLTSGYKIAGTGEIYSDGSVLEIGGVKYKLKGAVESDADIFLVPAGENYEECIKLKEEKGYDIEIVSIETFDDAVNYLESLKKEKE